MMAQERFPDAPRRIQCLPRDKRGFPVPKFVAWVDGEPQFPIANPEWLAAAHNEDRCYICGVKLGKYRASVIGPMCAVNRTISEPPSHTDCARFAAMHCPFLANPSMKRVPVEKLQQKCPAGGHTEESILRNPGAVCVWIATTRSRPERCPSGNWIFKLPEPECVEWYAHGRKATRAEVYASIESGIPLLRESCELEDSEARRAQAHRALDKAFAAMLPLLPAKQVTA